MLSSRRLFITTMEGKRDKHRTLHAMYVQKVVNLAQKCWLLNGVNPKIIVLDINVLTWSERG